MSSFVSRFHAGRLARVLCGLAAVLVAAPSRGEVMRSNLDLSPVGLLAASGISLDAGPLAAPLFTAAGETDASSASAMVLGTIAEQVHGDVVAHSGAEPAAPAQPPALSALDVTSLYATPIAEPAAAMSLQLVAFVAPEVSSAADLMAGSPLTLTMSPTRLGMPRVMARSAKKDDKSTADKAANGKESDKGKAAEDSATADRDAVTITAAPEPSTLALAGIGMATIVGVRFGRRPRRQSRSLA